MEASTKLRVHPFTVTVERNGQRYTFPIRGTHDMAYRLCERIDIGRPDPYGQTYGPLYYTGNAPRNGVPTTYDDRA